MRIKINENIEQTIINDLLTESFNPSAEKVVLIKDFLDKNFVKSSIDDIDSDGFPIKSNVFNMVSNGKTVKVMQPDELLLLLDDKFSKMIEDKDDRIKFLKQVLTDWFDGKISKNGLLSVNTI